MEPYLKSRRLLLLALCAWAIAWALPSGGESLSHSAFGWRCYVIAVDQAPAQLLGFFSAKGLNRLLKLLGAISPWTNLLVPLAILLLDRGRPAGLRSKLPGLFIGSWVVNLVWLKTLWNDLQLGYFVWLASFLCLGLAIFALQKHEGTQARSPFGQGGGTSSPVARAVAWIVLVILIGLAVPGFVDWEEWAKQ
jgi:hypothetical protein